MTELRQLQPEPPNERVIKRLEELFEQARKGDAQAFCAAVVHRRGACSVWRAGRTYVAPVVWALERAKLRLMGFVEDCDIELDLSGTDV